MHFSTKRFGPISTGHRQWRHDGHCSFVHGYGRTVKIIFTADTLDERGWVVDFGNLRDVKQWLEDQWDHRVLLAADDPLIEQFQKLEELGGINLNILPEAYGPGIEQSCVYVHDKVTQMVGEKTNYRCSVFSVEIWEHENNSAIYQPNSEHDIKLVADPYNRSAFR